jgi:hypothetical protein
MIELKKETMTNAIEKARHNRCHVKPLAFRQYAVTTPKGDTYLVTFDLQNGRKLGQCGCPAAEHERVCYHLAAAVQAHCMIMAMRQQAEPLCEVIAAPVNTMAAEENAERLERVWGKAPEAPAPLTDAQIDAEWDQASQARRAAEATEQAPAPAAATPNRDGSDELLEDLMDDDPDFWEAMGAKRPRKASNREHVLQGRASAGQASWKQQITIKSMLRDRGLDAEAECQRAFGFGLMQLSRRAASAWIDRLKTNEAPKVDVDAQVLVRPQPASIGRIRGMEI